MECVAFYFLLCYICLLWETKFLEVRFFFLSSFLYSSSHMALYMISMSWLRRQCLKFFIMRVCFWNARFGLFGLKSQWRDSSAYHLSKCFVGSLYILRENKISPGPLTIVYHLWVWDLKRLNDSEGLHFLSSPLECVCVKTWEGGNRSLCTACMTANTSRPNVLSKQRLWWTHPGLSRQILTGQGLWKKSSFFSVEMPPTEKKKKTSWDPPALLGTWAVCTSIQSSIS